MKNKYIASTTLERALHTGSIRFEWCVNEYKLILFLQVIYHIIMMTLSNGNIFWVTGPLWGEFTGHRWTPRTEVSDAEPEQTVEPTIVTPVIWYAIALIMTSP